MWFTASIGLLLAGVIVTLVRRDFIDPALGFFWLCVAWCFCVVGVFPEILGIIAGLVGIHYPPTVALVSLVGVLAIKLVKNDIRASKLLLSHRRLLQRVALLEAKLKEIERGN